MFTKLLCIFVLLLLICTTVQKKDKRRRQRKKERKETLKKQKQMEEALKKIDPDDIVGWSVETVIAELDENKNMECRVIHGLSKGQDGKSLESENAVVCQEQGLDKNTWYVKMVEFKEKKIYKKKGKKNIEEDYRFFEVFQAAKTKGLEFKPEQTEGEKPKKRKRKSKKN